MCAQTNWAYMATTPAGQIEKYWRVRRTYDRLATQGYDCAQAWLEGRPPPCHEAGVDAFWFAVASWAHNFMSDVLRDSPIFCAEGAESQKEISHQLGEHFYQPHLQFALYLQRHPSGTIVYRLDTRGMTPGQIILAHDAKWTMLGMKLAVRWQPLYVVKELRTLWDAFQLSRALRSPLPDKRWSDLPPLPDEAQYNPIALAYLEADLVFLRELFGHFEAIWNDGHVGRGRRRASTLNRIVAQFLDSVESELLGYGQL